MFDVLIIGLGAAGYTAAIYCARYKLKTMLIGEVEGGMGITAAEVGNWPGEIEIKGPDLMEKFAKHAKSFEEVTMKTGRVERIEKGIKANEAIKENEANEGFTLTLQSGEKIQGKTVILATGSSKRHLGVPGEEEFSGKGVTYCATCDAFFYRNKIVAVIGGGDSAVEGAAIAAQVAKKVYLIHRRSDFRAEPYWVDKVKARDNVTFVLENGLQSVVGDKKVTGLKLLKPFEGSDQLAVDGVFIEIGSDPATKLATELGAEVDGKGYLKVTPGMATNIPGLFGAGDVTNASNHFAQFVTAAGEGSVAANGAFQFLSTTRA